MTTVFAGFSILAFLSNSGVKSKSFQTTCNGFHDLSPPYSLTILAPASCFFNLNMYSDASFLFL